MGMLLGACRKRPELPKPTPILQTMVGGLGNTEGFYFSNAW